MDRHSQSAPTGTSQVPHTIVSQISELLTLYREAFVWGSSNGWPMVAKYPQYDGVRAIGLFLYRLGGHNALTAATLAVRCDEEMEEAGMARLLDWFWQGIGGWQP